MNKRSDFWFKVIGVAFTVMAAIFAAGSMFSDSQSVKARVEQLESGDKEIHKTIQALQVDQGKIVTNVEWIVKALGGTPVKK